jgi:hypothetical protein
MFESRAAGPATKQHGDIHMVSHTGCRRPILARSARHRAIEKWFSRQAVVPGWQARRKHVVKYYPIPHVILRRVVTRQNGPGAFPPAMWVGVEVAGRRRSTDVRCKERRCMGRGRMDWRLGVGGPRRPWRTCRSALCFTCTCVMAFCWGRGTPTPQCPSSEPFTRVTSGHARSAAANGGLEAGGRRPIAGGGSGACFAGGANASGTYTRSSRPSYRRLDMVLALGTVAEGGGAIGWPAGGRLAECVQGGAGRVSAGGDG